MCSTFPLGRLVPKLFYNSISLCLFYGAPQNAEQDKTSTNPKIIPMKRNFNCTALTNLLAQTDVPNFPFAISKRSMLIVFEKEGDVILAKRINLKGDVIEESVIKLEPSLELIMTFTEDMNYRLNKWSFESFDEFCHTQEILIKIKQRLFPKKLN